MADAQPVRPPGHAGMRHVALYVSKLEACVAFYTDLLGFSVEWHPDEDNIYLCSGTDNLALHRADGVPFETGRLDHIGIIIDAIKDVDTWYAFLVANDVEIAQDPKTHRDGARSFYCRDPDGTLVQLIYHPPISAGPPD